MFQFLKYPRFCQAIFHQRDVINITSLPSQCQFPIDGGIQLPLIYSATKVVVFTRYLKTNIVIVS